MTNDNDYKWAMATMLLSLLGLCCGDAESYPEPTEQETIAAPVVAPETTQEMSHNPDDYVAVEVRGRLPVYAESCELRFAVDTSLSALFEEATAGWSELSGCLITTGEGGIPVHHRAPGDECGDNKAAACTKVSAFDWSREFWWVSEMWITPGTRAQEILRVSHELGHSLGLLHTHDGVMAEHASTQVVTDSVFAEIELVHGR